jgi:hypothetical protein
VDVDLTVGEALDNASRIIAALLADDERVEFTREELEETGRVIGLIRMYATTTQNHYFPRN